MCEKWIDFAERFIKPSNEEILEEREKVAKAVLEMLKAQRDWKYTVLYSSKELENWEEIKREEITYL